MLHMRSRRAAVQMSAGSSAVAASPAKSVMSKSLPTPGPSMRRG